MPWIDLYLVIETFGLRQRAVVALVAATRWQLEDPVVLTIVVLEPRLLLVPLHALLPLSSFIFLFIFFLRFLIIFWLLHLILS